MQKYKKMGCLLAAVLVLGLLSGCSNDRLEDELAYRQVGINSMESGDYEGAVTAFDHALGLHIGKIGTNELDICYYKAAAQRAGGDTAGAMETYQALLEYNSKEADAYYLRGSLYLEMGDSEAALSDYGNAVKYNPDDYELYIHIYENLSAYNMTAEGEKYLNQAFDIKGSSAENLAWRGKIYYLLGQYDNAKTELEAALEKESKESMKANLLLAQVYDATGDTANAEKYYQAYVSSGAADSEAMNALGEIEIGKGNYSAALDYFRQGLAMEEVPNKQALMQNEIIACEYTGDFAGAWSVIQEYISLYPEDTQAQREYIFLMNRQGAGAADAGSEEPAEGSNMPDTEQGTEQIPEGTDTPAQ